MARARPNNVKGAVLSGIFSPKMRPCVSTARELTAPMKINWGIIDCNTEPFQMNSNRNQFPAGLTIIMCSCSVLIAPSPSVVAGVPFPHLASENAVLHGVIDEDDRQHDHRADQRKELARVARRGLPDRQRRRNDVRPDADEQTAEAEKAQREREKERNGFVLQPEG